MLHGSLLGKGEAPLMERQCLRSWIAQNVALCLVFEDFSLCQEEFCDISPSQATVVKPGGEWEQNLTISLLPPTLSAWDFILLKARGALGLTSPKSTMTQAVIHLGTWIFWWWSHESACEQVLSYIKIWMSTPLQTFPVLSIKGQLPWLFAVWHWFW